MERLKNLSLITPKKTIILAILLLGISLSFCLPQEINRADETWFLQVVQRVLDGNVLYKEVFFGAGPLSIYIPTLFCLPFGRAELIVLRILLACYFVIGILLSCDILKKLKISNYFSLTFVFSFFIFSHSQSTWGFSGYNGLAKVFFLACFSSMLSWSKKVQDDAKRDHRILLLSCLFAALCFCSKQNVGIIALFTILIILLIMVWKKELPRIEGFKQILYVLASFTFILFLCLAPTLLQGAFQNFMDYGFLNKSRYLKIPHPSYFLVPERWDLYSIFIFSTPFILLLFFLLSYSNLKKEIGVEKIIVFSFFIGALLTLYPCPDNIQKTIYIPFLLIMLTYLASHIPFFGQHRALRSFKWGLLTLFIFQMPLPFFLFLKKEKSFCKIPHFWGVLMDTSEISHWQYLKKIFLHQYEGETIYFLSTHCGFYYLIFDLPNPTPYDLPVHPALGQKGEDEILAMLQNGIINKVWMDHYSRSNWSFIRPKRHPLKIENYLSNQMKEVSIPNSPFLSMYFQSLEH